MHVNTGCDYVFLEDKTMKKERPAVFVLFFVPVGYKSDFKSWI